MVLLELFDSFSSRTVALGSNEPPTEMRTRSILWRVTKVEVHRADNLTTFMCGLS